MGTESAPFGFVALVAKNLQLLYQLGIKVDGELQRLDDLGIFGRLVWQCDNQKLAGQSSFFMYC
jgi:hypothetical protein